MPIYKSTAIYPLNPLRIIPANISLPSQYNTWPFDQGFFYQSIKKWFQSETNYYQKFNGTDNIVIYIDSLAVAMTVVILNNESETMTTVEFAVGGTFSTPGNIDPDFGLNYTTFLAQFSFSDLALPPGYYWVGIQMTYVDDDEPLTNTLYISECIEVKANHDRTMLFEYSNNQNDFGISWNTIIGGYITEMALRVEAFIDVDPTMHNLVFENMFYQTETLQAVPYRTSTLTVGQAGGVPKWMVDKLNRILCLTDFMIDGVSFTLETDSKWNWKKGEQNSWALQCGSINLRDNPQREEWIFSNLAEIGEGRIIDYTGDGTGA